MVGSTREGKAAAILSTKERRGLATPDPAMQRLHAERIYILDVTPQLDGGRFPVKRIIGDVVIVGATLVREGHDLLAGVSKYLHEGEGSWHEAPLRVGGDGRWYGSFRVEKLGLHQFTIEAWTDAFGSWRNGLRKKFQAGITDLSLELAEGAALVHAAAESATGAARTTLEQFVKELTSRPRDEAVGLGLDLELEELMRRHADRPHLTQLDKLLTILVERPAAQFSSWYELFPRSQSQTPGQHGTFAEVVRRLPEIARMGFDVLYLPPIHPIGRTNRKGRNNSLNAKPEDVGSPWAVGNEQGGHDAIEPALGSAADFKQLVKATADQGLELALDFALQCSPDHPLVKQHPDWFRHRADGSIAYAENPPKKYQDIFPVNFDTADWQALWHEWERVLLHWVALGVKVFRVDNPHTKPLGFWEWLLGRVRQQHPDVVFLSEAFTAAPLMHTLAKLGFSQSYTYFTWINDRHGLEQYLGELTRPPAADYFRPNLFANTPDILHAYLQHGGRAAFKSRAALAATLSPCWGIYSGFELCENTPDRPGSEEYHDSEKYQLVHRDWQVPSSIADYIARLNRARRQNSALQQLGNLRFHPCPIADVLCYSKATAAKDNVVLMLVNVHPKEPREGEVQLNLWELGLGENESYTVEDALTGQKWAWQGSRNFVRLVPDQEPAHVLVVRR